MHRLLTAPFRLCIIVILLSDILTACHSSRKLTAPATTVVVPDTLPGLPPSEIDLPLKIVGKPILAMADSIVPKEFSSEGWPSYLQTSCEFRYKYRFVRSGFTLGCTDNRITLQLQGAYQVAGGKCVCALGKPVSPWISGQCGFGSEPMRRVTFNLSSQLAFLPDYRVRTKSRLDQLQAPDKCIMSIFSMDMTGMILDSIRSSINGVCTLLDKTIGGLRFLPYIQHTIAPMMQKMPVGPYGWLATNATAIRVGTLNYVKDTFRINVGISCRPALVSDSNIDKHSPLAPFPQLGASGTRTGVSVYLPVVYDYAFMTKAMNDSLRNRSFVFKGRTITIKDMAIKSIGHHQVEIRIDFSGSKTGRLYLRGTPYLDTAKQGLSIPDISYSLESKDLALKMARSLFRNKIRKSLKGNSYLDLAALLKTHFATLDAQLTRQLAPRLYSNGNIRELRLIGLLATDKDIQAQVFVRANVSITSIGLP